MSNLSQEQMYHQSFKRPKNFFKLPPREQWEIDKRLGILDWDGRNLSNEQLEKIINHYD